MSRDCLDKSWKQYKNHEYQQAIESINSCLDDIISDGKPKEMDYAFFGLANNYIKLGDVDSALKYILIAYDLEKKYELDQSKTLNELGLIYIEKGMNHQAIYYLKKAKELNLNSNNKIEYKRNLSNLGFAYTNLEMKDSATAYLNSALKMSDDELKTNPMLLNYLAVSFFQNKDYSKSLYYLEQSFKNLTTKNNQLEIFIISTNLELVKLYNNMEINSSIFKEYLTFTKAKQNSRYFADANYKMSIIVSKEKDLKEGTRYLNVANSIYVELGNILKAKEITKTFLLANKISKVSNLKYSENELTELLNIEYSKQLEKDLEARISSDSYIVNMKEELYYSEISFYMVLSILISVLFTIGIAIYRIRKNNYIKMLIESYNNYLELIYQLDSNRLKLNLSKITNYMALDNTFREKQIFTELVDEVVKSGIDFQQNKRLNNV
jgi:tetratricopeptide (TPR) repeat protein